MIQFRLGTILASLVAVIASGTLFFRFAEGWDWLDSYFFTVVTISTVGYGNLVPATALGKIGTTVLIFLGLGVFAAAIQYIANFQMSQQERKLFHRHGHHHDPHPHPHPSRDVPRGDDTPPRGDS
jgi:voltage-gated potassium channel